MVLRANCRAAAGLPTVDNPFYRYGEPDPNPLQSLEDPEFRRIDMEIAERMQAQGTSLNVLAMWSEAVPFVPPRALSASEEEEAINEDELQNQTGRAAQPVQHEPYDSAMPEEEDDDAPEYIEFLTATGRQPEPGLAKIIRDSRRRSLTMSDLVLHELSPDALQVVAHWCENEENLMRSYHGRWQRSTRMRPTTSGVTRIALAEAGWESRK
jgi:hypothetical protein